jgi:hypothetical protein
MSRALWAVGAAEDAQVGWSAALLGKERAMKAKATGTVVLLLAGWMAGTARADFTLRGNQQVTVNTAAHEYGVLYDQSKAWIVAGGYVSARLSALHDSTAYMSDGFVQSFASYNNGTVNISGGSVIHIDAWMFSTVNFSGGTLNGPLYAFDSSIVNISGGWVREGIQSPILGVWAGDTSTVNISGGNVNAHVYAGGTSTVNISGGSVSYLCASDSVAVTFDGKDFILGTGLSLSGYRVLGTGTLSGKWMDGTAWATTISVHDAGAIILAIPEPATLSLLALGGLAVMRRRR